MLEEIGSGARIFLKAEPSNAYDKNAYRVLVWKNDKFNHVGYVQRHSAAKIAAAVQGPGSYVVGRLRNATGKPDMFEVEINGTIYDPKNLIKRDEAVKNDTGIFGEKKKPVNEVKFRPEDLACIGAVSKKYIRGQYGYYDHDIDAELYGGIDEADCF